MCTAFVEGPRGESVSGALVNVSDSSNQITQLAYDYNSGSYSGRIEENTGTYIFGIRSLLLDEPRRIAVPYTAITRSPSVMVLQDSEGNSALNGEYLNAGLPIQAAWSSSGSGIVYQISVRTPLRTFYAVSTNAETITIPGNAIPQGTFTLGISAQKIYGDPSFETSDYYSLSNSATVGMSFNVN
jgi:hypothetical protein